MAETDAIDDLSAPLGQKTARKRRFRLPFTALQVIAALLGLFLTAFAGFAIFSNNPLGGEPTVQIALRRANPPDEKTEPASDHGTKAAPKEVPSGEQKTVTIIDGSSGTHHDVVIGSEDAGKASAGKAEGKAERDGGAAAMMTGIDQRLLENARYGMIPAMSGGLKPFTAYAAPADQAKAAKMPVVGSADSAWAPRRRRTPS